jgi:hypothetical protein
VLLLPAKRAPQPLVQRLGEVEAAELAAEREQHACVAQHRVGLGPAERRVLPQRRVVEFQLRIVRVRVGPAGDHPAQLGRRQRAVGPQ